MFVPWVLASQAQPRRRNLGTSSSDHQDAQKFNQRSEIGGEPTAHDSPPVYKRYYHMFAKGELTRLVQDAAEGMDLAVGRASAGRSHGVEITQDGWERSNYYVELRRWRCK